MKPIMTIREVRLDLRSRGLNISDAKISEYIKSGLFSFGAVTSVGETGRTTFLIFRKAYEKWADENL